MKLADVDIERMRDGVMLEFTRRIEVLLQETGLVALMEAMRAGTDNKLTKTLNEAIPKLMEARGVLLGFFPEGTNYQERLHECQARAMELIEEEKQAPKNGGPLARKPEIPEAGYL